MCRESTDLLSPFLLIQSSVNHAPAMYWVLRFLGLTRRLSVFVSDSTISTLAKQVCLGKPEWEKHWGSNRELMNELEGRPEWCLDLTFMHALLRLGYEFGSERTVEIGKQIDGTELGWCLGATIAMVGAELKCRV